MLTPLTRPLGLVRASQDMGPDPATTGRSCHYHHPRRQQIRHGGIRSSDGSRGRPGVRRGGRVVIPRGECQDRGQCARYFHAGCESYVSIGIHCFETLTPDHGLVTTGQEIAPRAARTSGFGRQARPEGSQTGSRSSFQPTSDPSVQLLRSPRSSCAAAHFVTSIIDHYTMYVKNHSR